jgi:hypothetical protein
LAVLRTQRFALDVMKGRTLSQSALCLNIFALLATLAAAPVSVFANENPNIVYILVDNWGSGDISVQGSTVSQNAVGQRLWRLRHPNRYGDGEMPRPTRFITVFFRGTLSFTKHEEPCCVAKKKETT